MRRPWSRRVLVIILLGWTTTALDGAFPGKDDPRQLLKRLPPPRVAYPQAASPSIQLLPKDPVELPAPKPIRLPASASLSLKGEGIHGSGTRRAKPSSYTIKLARPRPTPDGGGNGGIATASAAPGWRDTSGSHATGTGSIASSTPSGSESRPTSIPRPDPVATGSAKTPPQAAKTPEKNPLPREPGPASGTPAPKGAGTKASESPPVAAMPALPASETARSPASPTATGPRAVTASATSPGSTTAEVPSASGPEEVPQDQATETAEAPLNNGQGASDGEPASDSVATGDETASDTGSPEEGNPEETPAGPSVAAEAALVEARKLKKDQKWDQLLQMLQDNPEAAATPEGMGMVLEGQLNGKKVNYMSVRNTATALLEKSPEDPYGNWAMAEALANAKKPDLAQALVHLAKARKAKVQPPGLTVRYYTLLAKKNWIFLLLGLGALVAGVDALRKKRKKAAGIPAAGVPVEGAAVAGSPPESSPAAPPGDSPVPAAAAPSMAQKIKGFLGGLLAKLRRPPKPTTDPEGEKAVTPEEGEGEQAAPTEAGDEPSGEEVPPEDSSPPEESIAGSEDEASAPEEGAETGDQTAGPTGDEAQPDASTADEPPPEENKG